MLMTAVALDFETFLARTSIREYGMKSYLEYRLQGSIESGVIAIARKVSMSPKEKAEWLRYIFDVHQHWLPN